jgi:hypothetical protein
MADIKTTVEDVQMELMDEFDGLDVELLLPSATIAKEIAHEREECIIKDESLLVLYDEILTNCRKDRGHADEILSNFLDMVLNDGDASSASKEAIVNVLNIKSGISDKMTKIADLMTRMKMKDKDTFPRYLAQQTNNKVVIEGSKRDLIKSMNKMVKDGGKKKGKEGE